MKFMKKEYLQRKTRERGQASWVLGLFLILFLAILLCMQLQVALYRESAMYMEDALALSNLASAVIDIEEYGSDIGIGSIGSHSFHCQSPSRRAFRRVRHAYSGLSNARIPDIACAP